MQPNPLTCQTPLLVQPNETCQNKFQTDISSCFGEGEGKGGSIKADTEMLNIKQKQ